MAGARWPRFLPDLTLWHAWHASHDTLPARWKGQDLSAVCRELGVAEWRLARPWRIEHPGVAVRKSRDPAERTVTWETAAGTLRARWVLGPDGDWWQSEYPVKSRADFDAAAKVVAARTYVADPSRLAARPGHSPDALEALELPRSPLPELFHSFLGWSEGLMLFFEEPDTVRELAGVLDAKVRALLGEIARMPGTLAFAPDNLDGRFITPDMFAEHLAPLYAAASAALHASGKAMVVHLGGQAAGLLPAIAGCGIDCAEGVCGAPQGDSTLAEARAACGPGMTVWGGIPQDALLETSPREEFETAARAAFADAAADPQAVVGVADRVPVGAVPERLDLLSRLARDAGRRES